MRLLAAILLLAMLLLVHRLYNPVPLVGLICILRGVRLADRRRGLVDFRRHIAETLPRANP